LGLDLFSLTVGLLRLVYGSICYYFSKSGVLVTKSTICSSLIPFTNLAPYFILISFFNSSKSLEAILSLFLVMSEIRSLCFCWSWDSICVITCVPKGSSFTLVSEYKIAREFTTNNRYYGGFLEWFYKLPTKLPQFAQLQWNLSSQIILVVLPRSLF